jgi:TonB-linked SusC/RagA family outer membrane protein
MPGSEIIVLINKLTPKFMKRILLIMLFASVCVFLDAQSLQITGTVSSSEDGSPMAGVTVSVKGTTMGTITGADGKFTVSTRQGVTLVFSFIGYKTTEVVVNNSDRLDIRMTSEMVKMDEVIVVAYGTSKRSSYTGSAQKISSDQLQAVKAESIDKALAGKVSGVRVASLTGDPGASGAIQIRGIGSINGTTSPLYVVDGIPVVTGNFGSTEISSNVLSSINPEDIESMTILKDAAAASLYGSRAANGVVIITTKKGMEGNARFSLSVKAGTSRIATDSYKVMSGPQYIEYERAALVGYYLDQIDGLVPGGANYNDPAALQEANDWVDANISDLTNVDDPDVSTNWRDAIYGTGKNQELQFSASGGNEKTKFYTGLGYKYIKGIVPMNKFSRYTGTINLDNKSRKWLDLSFSTMLSYSDQTGRMDQSDQVQGIANASPLGLLLSGNPTSMIYNSDGSFNMNASFNTNIKNPLFAIQPSQSYTSNKTYRAICNGSATIRFTDYLSVKSTNALDFIYVEGFRRWAPTSVDGLSLNGLGERPNSNVSQMTTSDILLFNKSFGKHSLNALAGFEASLYNYLSIFTAASNYSTDKLEELGVGQPRNATSSKFGRYLQSYISNVNYNYSDKYYIAGSLRMDESSQLGVEKRKALFYSLSAGWRFAQENFLKADWLTDGKLRFSYGTNGNLPTSSYEHLGLYNFGGIYGSESAIWISQPENKNLGWEMSYNMNAGLDISLFNMLSFTVEYFNKNTRGLLLYVPTSYLTGFETALQNTGEIRNQGLEFELHLSDLLNSPLHWNIDLSLSTLKSTVLKLPGGNDIIAGDGNNYIYSEGKDMYTFYLPTWYDVDPECGLARFLIDPSQPATTSNMTYYYSQAKRSFAGKAYPDIIGGMNVSLSYKGFTLSSLITYQFGGNMFDYPGYFMNNYGSRYGTWNWSEDLVGNTWQKPGDVAIYPRPVAFWSARPDRWSTKHILSTDFARLKEILLEYKLPETLIPGNVISDIKFSVSAENLLFLYQAVKNVDPEVSLNGYRTVDTPLSRTISFGLSLNF